MPTSRQYSQKGCIFIAQYRGSEVYHNILFIFERVFVVVSNTEDVYEMYQAAAVMHVLLVSGQTQD